MRFSSGPLRNLESAFLRPSCPGIASIFYCTTGDSFLHKELRFAVICRFHFYLKFTLDKEG